MAETGLAALTQRFRVPPWLRPLWMALALGAAGWFLFTHREEILSQPLNWWTAAGALLVTICGKIFSALHVRFALAAFGERLTLVPSLYAYSVSDAGKYVPGFVWSIVSRVALYRAFRLNAGVIGRTLVVEQVWYIGAAGTMGLALYLWGRLYAWYLVPLPLVAWIAVLLLINRRMPVPADSGKLFLLFAVQLCQWLLLGSGFAVLMPPEVPQAVAMGAFLIAFAAGMAMPFAPGGIGVRELTVGFFLLPFQSAAVIGYEVLLSRAIWIAADVIFTLTIVFTCRRAWNAAVAVRRGITS